MISSGPYNQFTIPDEELTGNDGNATLVFRRDANFPASDLQQQLTLFIRATKPARTPRRYLVTTARAVPLRANPRHLHGRAATPRRGRRTLEPIIRLPSHARFENKDAAASRRNHA